MSFNPAVLSQYGYKPEELIGENIKKLRSSDEETILHSQLNQAFENSIRIGCNTSTKI